MKMRLKRTSIYRTILIETNSSRTMTSLRKYWNQKGERFRLRAILNQSLTYEWQRELPVIGYRWTWELSSLSRQLMRLPKMNSILSLELMNSTLNSLCSNVWKQKLRTFWFLIEISFFKRELTMRRNMIENRVNTGESEKNLTRNQNKSQNQS